MPYLSDAEIRRLDIRAGRNVLISRDARVFGGDRVTIGDNVRIDAFCIISAGGSGHVRLGNHIHISSGVRIFGDGNVTLGDFATISSGSTLYSASDDFSGEHLIGPTQPDELTLVDKRPILMGDLAAVGAHAVVLPGVTMGEGSVLGSMSLARESLDPWTIYVGVPCRPLRERSRRARELANEAASRGM